MIPLLCLHAAVNRWSAWLGLKKGKCGAMYALLKLQDIFTRQSKITLFDPLYLVKSKPYRPMLTVCSF